VLFFFGPKLRGMSRYNPDKIRKVRTRQNVTKSDYEV
jgi:hypothetical protein